MCVENTYVGAMLFTIGLFTIYTLNFNLYTGKVGFLLEDKDIVAVLLIWLGNLAGTVGTGILFLNTRLVTTTTLVSKATSVSAVKIGDGLLSAFILGCFCGLMMYIAAKSYKLTHDTCNSVGGYVGMFLCVMLFLLLGFEHSVANMFYFTVAGAWSGEAVVALIVVSLGNAVGALFPNALLLLVKTPVTAGK